MVTNAGKGNAMHVAPWSEGVHQLPRVLATIQGCGQSMKKHKASLPLHQRRSRRPLPFRATYALSAILAWCAFVPLYWMAQRDFALSLSMSGVTRKLDLNKVPHMSQCGTCNHCGLSCGTGVFFLSSATNMPKLNDLDIMNGLPKHENRGEAQLLGSMYLSKQEQGGLGKCTLCQGCQHILQGMDVTSSFLNEKFTHRIGFSDAWLFRVPIDPCGEAVQQDSQYAVVKTWCVPYKHSVLKQGPWWEVWRSLAKIKGNRNKIVATKTHASPKQCSNAARHEETSIVLAVTNIAAECGMSDLLPKAWSGPLNGIMPKTGYPISTEALWMTEARGVSMDQIMYWTSHSDVAIEAINIIKSEQVVQAAIFDLLTSQCDRHANNVFMDENGSIVLIDNGDALGRKGKCHAGTSLSSLFIPGTGHYAYNRYGRQYLELGLPFLKWWYPGRSVMLDYRCHAPGGVIGKAYPPSVQQCLKRFSQLSESSLTHSLGLPNIETGAYLKQRASDMLDKGFEWTVQYGEPRNSKENEFYIEKPCCRMKSRGRGILNFPQKYDCVGEIGISSS